jgi:hypothetical protein
VCWQHFTTPNKQPYLREGQEAYAGVLWAPEPKSDAPRLWLFPIDLTPECLFDKRVPLDEQIGLRLKITATYRAKEVSDRERLVIRRSYYIKPDESQPLKYKAKRVCFGSLFWKD